MSSPAATPQLRPVDQTLVLDRVRLRSEVGRVARWTMLATIGSVAFVACITWQAYRTERELSANRQELANVQAKIAAERAQLDDLKTQYKTVLAVANAQSTADPKKPLYEQIQPKASANPVKGIFDPNGRQVYDFLVWLDIPENRKNEVEKVDYEFNHPSFFNKQMESTNPSNNFSVGYRGWGALRLVTIIVHLKTGEQHKFYFDQFAALGWDKAGS